MKKRILLLCAVLALATLATAQTTTGTQRNTNDNVRITSGPSVTTTDNSATIRWKTDDLASTNLKYGTDQNMSQTQKHSGGARDHNVELTNLQPGTTYYFAIMTNDGDVRQQGTFTTKGTSSASNSNNTNDNVRITSGPNVATTDNSATIRWKTDDLASTNVKYGTDQNMSQTQKHSGGARDHNVELTNLQPGTTYYFAIMTNDGDVRQQGTFTTKGTSSASNSNNTATQTGSMTTGSTDNIQITMGPEIRNFNGSTATLYWQTDKVAANEVHYGNSQGSLNQKAYEPGGSREHSVELTNLQPGQTYYFEILRRNGSIREPGSFTLPSNVNASATSAHGYPSIPVQMSNGTYQNGSNYPNGGNYPNGNYPNGNYPNGATTGAVQIVNGPMVETVSDTQAVISWTTNQPSSSTVRFGQSWLALNQQAQAPWSTDHRVTVTGLRPNTKYFFRVESAAAQGTSQVARSQFGTFQTGAPGQAAQAPRR